MAADAQAAWPALRAGFFGRMAGGATLLGISAPPGPRGGPVFDARGRLAGVALAASGGPDQLITCEAIADGLGEPQWPAAGTPTAPQTSLEAVLETGMQLGLQLLVVR